MITGILIGLGIGIVLLVGFVVLQKRQQGDSEKAFEQHAQKALGLMMQEVIKTTRDQLSAEKKDISETIAKDLRSHSDHFKEVTQALKQEIDERQREIRSLEEDRNKKFGELTQALVDYKTLTQELRGSTEQLKRILASNQLRGSWGERQAEKILEAAGMVDGINFVKQRPIASNPNLRPDFTLLLTNQMEIHVDVKFPLQSLQTAMLTENAPEQQRALQQFTRDVKDRLKEACKYIIQDGKCVDYVILFVPSESVYEIINKNMPGLVDEAFSQKVIMVSPHSFFAVVRTIQESYANFHYEQNLKEILTYLQNLLTQFDRFKGEFADVGRALESAQTKFKQIEGTRYSQITKAADKINSFQVNQGEQPLLLEQPIVELEQN